MLALSTFLAIYLLGGLTFLPAVLFIVYRFVLPAANCKSNHSEHYKNVKVDHGKEGWVRITNHYDPSGGKRFKNMVYAVLKHGTMFVYESDRQLECKLIIPVHDYVISMHPDGQKDHEMYNKSMAVRLQPKKKRPQSLHGVNEVSKQSPPQPNAVKSKTDTDLLNEQGGPDEYWSLDQDIFVQCARAIDKEDWYFELLEASDFMPDAPDPTHVETVDETRFDFAAMEHLIGAIHRDPDHRQVQWLNAILGRMFLGVYKTDRVKHFFESKFTKKLKKIKRPSFLDEVTIQDVRAGHAIPYFSRIKLLTLDVDGRLEAEAHVDYTGGLCVVIETDIHWSYSSRLKPIRVHLVLSVTLKQFRGRFKLMIKKPPTNRFWLGFYEEPEMVLDIKPIVSDKQIKLNMVTNAIETKIREVFAETLVLPNMDDFVFCDTDGQGGVFGAKEAAAPEVSIATPTAPPTSKVVEPKTEEAGDYTPKPVPKRHESDHHLLSAPSPTVNHVSRSAPNLLQSETISSTTNGNGTPATNTSSASMIDKEKQETASVESSSDSSSNTIATTATTSSSIAIRWPIRRKKARKDSIESIDDSASTNTERRSTIYQRAETLWQRSKEVLKDEEHDVIHIRRRLSETNDRITRHRPPPPPPPPPAAPSAPATPQQKQQKEQQQQESLSPPTTASSASVAPSPKPPLPPRASTSPPTPPRKPPLPPRIVDQSEERPPIPPRTTPNSNNGPSV